MTAVAPAAGPETGRASTTRWVVLAVVVVAAVAFALWFRSYLSGLSYDTRVRNPVLGWEYVFKRPETIGELRDRTIEHLKLTVIPVTIGIVLAAGLTLVARRFRWTLAPITVFASFLYVIPSFALFAILVTYTSNFAAAVVALTSYTLLILVRNFVAGLDAVPKHVLDAADGLGMTPTRRLLTVEIPLALPVIITGIRVATVTVVGLVAVSFIIQLGGLGKLIFEGYSRQYTTLMVIGTVLSVALAIALDLLIDRAGRLLTPWVRGRAAA